MTFYNSKFEGQFKSECKGTFTIDSKRKFDIGKLKENQNSEFKRNEKWDLGVNHGKFRKLGGPVGRDLGEPMGLVSSQSPLMKSKNPLRLRLVRE